jgi:hypothetical protein
MNIHLDLNLTEEQNRALQAAVAQAGIALDELVERALEDYLRKLELERPQNLLLLSDEERNRRMEASAALMEDEYRNNPELTAFEAYEILDYDDYLTDTNHS